MTDAKQKIVEKYYIEITPSWKKRFLISFAGGIGWGLGVLVSSTIIIAIITYFISKIDFIPILGQFLNDITTSSTSTPSN
ncbi:hypothetical protein A3J17_03930 [Candidatus Curtissbacteria bacterium RIFCSPLOWO2_02_FULL_40_11]|uniref:Uncharacterized protein n=2 Tax=Candidatus Curtissiibacteriota TaxID=1752717 RepID=A0A1F5G6S8_9BACT|nr:MAG: hypothetical protein A2775_02260 [Candidatus Curtissbacteria bacterium RIFCSPHIGHO2_01_FULL_39_57]OGD87590.1 MAG: hypothetical protein A3D04_04920 [Candidatus Curtissbacteria bacterium RIFCSPHIGHO2_02_FULL_40_16b]OGD89972.1 MAG: hypothetical protein A3E11_02455 [Candidatus Curtissbacteria bacterium RIFCSPHIGHO2_12_FULL_38_37]OGE00676.1 MAG: hypothetical protein A3J17_03930 [Candidatus Curtissbacteria bacterium RIFCSPLOWO2_02_FULL_40_11]OGE13353.1 MAG: hypothetical protein A3G14_01605 [C